MAKEPLTAEGAKVAGRKKNGFANLQKKVAEKSILLSLNSDIANVRDKKDILQLIHPKLKLLFDTDDIFISFLDTFNETLDPILRVGGATRVKHPDYDRIVNSSFPIHDGFIDKILQSAGPVVFDITKFPNPVEYMKLLKATGLAETLSISLHNAGEVVGVLTLWSETRDFFTSHHKKLISEIANHISIIVVNILASEAIKKKDKQNEILLLISNEIARIRGKEDLLHIIHNTVRQHIYFDDSFILRYNKNSKTCRAYIYNEERGSGNPGFENGPGAEYHIYDDEVAVPQVPRIQDVAALSSSGSEEVSFINSTGIAEFVSIKLIEGNELIGLFVLLSKQKNSFKPGDLDLLQRISYQISIATANIIANEEIAKREQEKTILLSLSDEIASLKSRNDLFDVVNNRIKKIFSITQFGIVKINEDRATHSAFMMDIGDTFKNQNEFTEVTNLKYSIADRAFSSVMASDDFVILDVNQLAEERDPPAYVHFWQEVGFKQLLCLALRVGGNIIGAVFFNTSLHEINNLKSNLLKAVCAQLSVAVSNILANEEITRREDERELLLSLNMHIAAIRNTDDLVNVITQKLKKLLSFSHISITTINADKTTVRAFVVDPGSKSRGHPVYDHAKLSNYLINDGVMNKAFATSAPVIFDLEQLGKSRELPLYLQVNFESGIRQVAVVRFSKGDDVFGFWFIFFDQEINPDLSKRSLIEGLANQISIAISNIIANQDIQRREEEKSKLLAFSNTLAAVRDRKQLSIDLSEELRKFGVIGNYSLRMITGDKKHHQIFLYDERDYYTSHPAFRRILGMPGDIDDGITNIVLNSNRPVTFSIKELNQRKIVPPYVKWWQEIGLIELTGIAVRLGDENVGILWLNIPVNYDKAANYPLLKSICSQIGIALSNILANEKIIAQLTEINKYKQQLEEEKIYLKEEIATSQNYTEIIGGSPEIKKVFRLIAQVAYSDSTVLLLGETGTGKELIARAIHNNSQRKSKLMVKVNCAALPANLIESELFGHERGSFTGAYERRIGKFELANNGTLFLDEIGEMPLDLQVKLLRALQEKEIERVGGKTTVKTDARIIAATNRDLEKLMEEGKFRSDLYYRLNIFPIMLPSLRNRREDISQLASYFIARYSKKAGKKINTINNKVLQELVRYDWPGNIRELENLIERSVLLATGDTIKEIHLPHQKKNLNADAGAEDIVIKTIDENEKEYILKILKHVKGRIGGVGGAAELLGVPTSTLNSRIKRLGIRKEHLG